MSPKQGNASAQLNERRDFAVTTDDLLTLDKIGDITEGVGPAGEVPGTTAHPSPTRDQCILKRPNYLNRHFQFLHSLYGPIVAVTLIDLSGGEHTLGEEYEIQVVHGGIAVALFVVHFIE